MVEKSIFDFAEDKNFPQYYKVCRNTGLRYYIPARKRVYENSYFLEEYKNQYKKTYYEDESFLRRVAKERIQLIRKYLSTNSPSIFEIGSAAGFFLDEAKKNGFSVSGIEISENEVRYAKSIGIDIPQISFDDFKPSTTYDVVASFFVLEHFEDQESALLKIASMINEGGLFVLALPSLKGPTFCTNPDNWFFTHPSDHFVDYDPSSLARIFQELGFKTVFQKPFSYHKSRDLGWRGKFLTNSIYKTLADWTCYGDTLQIIAKKVKK